MLISPLYMNSTSTLMSENLTSRIMTMGSFSSYWDKIVSKYVLHADRTTCEKTKARRAAVNEGAKRSVENF